MRLLIALLFALSAALNAPTVCAHGVSGGASSISETPGISETTDDAVGDHQTADAHRNRAHAHSGHGHSGHGAHSHHHGAPADVGRAAPSETEHHDHEHSHSGCESGCNGGAGCSDCAASAAAIGSDRPLMTADVGKTRHAIAARDVLTAALALEPPPPRRR